MSVNGPKKEIPSRCLCLLSESVTDNDCCLSPASCFPNSKLEHVERWFSIISPILSVCNTPVLTLCSDSKPQCVSGLVVFILEVKKSVT